MSSCSACRLPEGACYSNTTSTCHVNPLMVGFSGLPTIICEVLVRTGFKSWWSRTSVAVVGGISDRIKSQTVFHWVVQ